MNKHCLSRRSPRANARRERLLSQLQHSGLSAYAFARKHHIPYTTLISWRKRTADLPVTVSFTEVELPPPAPEPLILEIGSHARVRLTSSSQIALAAELLKHLQA